MLGVWVNGSPYCLNYISEIVKTLFHTVKYCIYMYINNIYFFPLFLHFSTSIFYHFLVICMIHNKLNGKLIYNFMLFYVVCCVIFCCVVVTPASSHITSLCRAGMGDVMPCYGDVILMLCRHLVMLKM